MNRRDLLASLALTGLVAEAQEAPAPPPNSLYIPKAHLVEDRRFLHDFMDEFAFADLVTASPGPRITHIPVLLEREAGPYGTVRGHISRQNEQAKAFDGRQEAVVVFRGPHGYISPAWFGARPAVPTWNFAVVHASGKPRAVTEPEALRAFLARLIGKFESYQGTDYDFSKQPASYVNGMLGGIVGFEMRIELLEGKFKLGQERNEADRESLLSHLAKARGERSLRELSESFYRRKG